MRPLQVILLLLVAAGALFFFLNNTSDDTVGDDGLNPEQQDPGVTPVSTDGLVAPDSNKPEGRDVIKPPTTIAGQEGEAVAAANNENVLTGRVVNAKDEPVSGARVLLTARGPMGFPLTDAEYDESMNRAAETDGDGAYYFQNIVPYDTYALVVTHEDYYQVSVPNVQVGEEGEFVEPPIMLHAGTLAEGAVRDREGNGIAGARVVMDGMEFMNVKRQNPAMRVTETNEEGYYAFTNCSGGSHTFSASADGFANAYIPNRTFEVTKGPNTIDIVLDVAEMIQGTVVDQANKPLKGATVMAVSISNLHSQCRDTAKSKADGRFSIERLRPGQYTLVASLQGYKSARAQRTEAGAADVVLELSRKACVSGTVLDASGAPLPSFSAMLRVTYPNSMVTSPTNLKATFKNDDGSFELCNADDQNYVIEASAPGYAPTFSVPFAVEDGRSVSGITIQLMKGGTVKGEVLDSTGKPIAGAKVSSHANDYTDDDLSLFLQIKTGNATERTAKTGKDGRFELTGLMAETYQVRISASGFCEYAKSNLALAPEGQLDLGPVRLARGGTVWGSVTSKNTRNMSGVRVTLNADRRTTGEIARSRHTKTAEDGSFRFENVPPGTYRVVASPPAGVAARNPFTSPETLKGSQESVNVREGSDSKVHLRF